MALTNTQYDTIIREYNKKQLQNRRDQEARIALAEKELPELSQINGEIASLSMKCARRLLEGEAASIDDLKTEIAAYGIRPNRTQRAKLNTAQNAKHCCPAKRHCCYITAIRKIICKAFIPVRTAKTPAISEMRNVTVSARQRSTCFTPSQT